MISYLIIDKILKKDNIAVSKVINYDNHKNVQTKQFNNENWNEFVANLEKEGRYRFYCLLNQTSVVIDNNNISISLKNKKELINVLNNPNTIDFIEKEIYDKYGLNVNIITEKGEETTFLHEDIKNKLISIFDAIEE